MFSMTSQTILETLENNIETISTTLNPDEKDQFIGLLSNVAGTEEDKAVEDAVDDLFNFCLKVPFLKGILTKADTAGGHIAFQRGKPDPKALSEKEKQVRLITNRLIKALQEPTEKDKNRG
jgi:hypothetical protein